MADNCVNIIQVFSEEGNHLYKISPANSPTGII